MEEDEITASASFAFLHPPSSILVFSSDLRVSVSPWFNSSASRETF